MIGIELKEKVSPYLQRLTERGVLAIGGGSNVLRLLPPLVIPEDQWAYAVDTIGQVLTHG